MKKRMSLKRIVNNRINIFTFLLIMLFILLSFRISYLTIFENDFYSDKLSSIINTSYSYSSSPRGRILDRNYNVLVDNREVPTLYFLKNKRNSSYDEINLAKKISSLIDLDYSKVTLRMKKDYYLIICGNSCNNLISSSEWKKYEERLLSDNDIYYLKLSRITSLSSLSEEDVKASYIYYLMNNGYFYEEKIIKKDLSDVEISSIYDNLESLDNFYIKYSWERFYPYGDTFRSILGNVSSIPKERKDYYLNSGYSLNDLVGTSFLEMQYEKYMRGEKGKYKIIDGEVTQIKEGKRGNDIVLTIDINLQKEIEDIIKKEIENARYDAATKFFNKVFVVIKDPKNGDILAMSGIELFENNDILHVKDVTPMVITSPITPGSVVKGASILTGYKEGALEIGQKIKDECIKIYSKPRKCSWSSLGMIDDISALSLSSNVYQFKTAMKVAGINYSYNIKFDDAREAFDKYRKMFNSLGLGVKTEIDLPVDGIGEIGNKDDADLFLNYVIGQYDTYTTMQLSEYISTIANKGTRIKPHLLKEVRSNDDDILYVENPMEINKVDIDSKYIDRVIEGFNSVTTDGLGKSFMRGIEKSAGKTGTSESFYDSDGDGIIDTPTLTNSFVGFYPYDDPVMSIAITFPNIVDDTYKGARTWANIKITRSIVNIFNELYNK